MLLHITAQWGVSEREQSKSQFSLAFDNGNLQFGFHFPVQKCYSYYMLKNAGKLIESNSLTVKYIYTPNFWETVTEWGICSLWTSYFFF